MQALLHMFMPAGFPQLVHRASSRWRRQRYPRVARKRTLSLVGAEQERALHQIADRHGIEVPELVRRAVAVYTYAVESAARGNTLEIVNSDRTNTSEITLP